MFQFTFLVATKAYDAVISPISKEEQRIYIANEYEQSRTLIVLVICLVNKALKQPM